MPPSGPPAGSPRLASGRLWPPLPPRATRGGATTATLAAWPFVVMRGTEQALEDLAASGAAEVVFVRHPRATAASDHLEEVAQHAREIGFVTAQVRAGSECAFDVLESVVRAMLLGLRPAEAGAPRPGRIGTARARTARASRGLTALLDAFITARGAAAIDRLEAGLLEEGLHGDVALLARAYVASEGSARERARIDAWLDGVELARASSRKRGGEAPDPDEPSEVAALSGRTSKQVLAEVTRLVRALGWRGTLVVVEASDAIANFPPARRQAAYTVLRELIDNADGGRGMTSTLLLVAGTTSLFSGPRSIHSLPPLAARVEPPEAPPTVPPPHRPVVDLTAPEGWNRSEARRSVRPAERLELGGERSAALRDVVRAMHGLPPLSATPSASVGQESIDRAIDALFAHSRVDGSVFALITGEYGAGKTHFLLHLAARALAERRPVLRLSLERLDMDLGHPERHLRRLLEHAVVPAQAGEEVGALELLSRWTHEPLRARALMAALEEQAHAEGDAAHAAARALTVATRARRADRALMAHLGAMDLAARAPGPGVRRDAYGRLLLWLVLLDRLEGCAGPVLLIDEAENLYRGGATKPERRTALRSLSFYCGGALPRAAVALAVTPDALVELAEEAPTLLDDVAEQRSLLPWEDASMLCRRLARARPIPVPALGPRHRAELARRVRANHEVARGAVSDSEWERFVARVAAETTSPRDVVRRTADRLERIWWHAQGLDARSVAGR